MKKNSTFLTFALSPLLLTAQASYAYVYAIGDKPPSYKAETHETDIVKTPIFEGGFTASIGTIYVAPSADNQSFGVDMDTDPIKVINFDPDYQFGIDASLGYVFEDTANAIELFYRELSTDDSATHIVQDFDESVSAEGTLSYEFNALDLMVSQFMDVGNSMQMRFMGGLSYLELNQHIKANTTISDTEFEKNKSDFSGWGLRVGVDSRYDFGQGFGIVGGGSLGYYAGELDVTSLTPPNVSLQDNRDNHTVANLRANLGVDYVYFMGQDTDHSTVGLELGYLFDYYNDAAGSITGDVITADTYAVSFNGPYLNLKGVF